MTELRHADRISNARTMTTRKIHAQKGLLSLCVFLSVSTGNAFAFHTGEPLLERLERESTTQYSIKGLSGTLTAKSGETSCLLEGDVLTCSYRSIKEMITLDTGASGAIGMYFSEMFSVIVTDGDFIVSIGPGRILAGVRSIGYLGGLHPETRIL